MDSEILVILPAAQAAHAEQVHALFAGWEARLSRFRADSDLSRLNASAGRPIETRDPLTHVLRRALRAAAATGGVFDPTLGRDLRDAGYARSFQQLGAASEYRAPGDRISSWRDVRIGALGVVSVPFDLSIDLGGIAKGMAVDAALDALQAEGVDYALVSAGGDLAVRGTLPDGRPWPISISLAQRDVTVTLAGGAIADLQHPEAELADQRGTDAPSDRPAHPPAVGERTCARHRSRPDLRGRRGGREDGTDPRPGGRPAVSGAPPPGRRALHAGRVAYRGRLAGPEGAGRMSTTSVAWYTVRASGYTALVLLTLSMLLGLVMSLRIRSPHWPRFLTNDLHAFVTLVSLVFIAIHVATTIVDPYIHFGLKGALVPFETGYRSIGMALGIVGTYLMLAVWISSQLQKWIGWRTWRALHYAVFAVYVMAVLHTVLAGEDGGTAWGRWITVGSVALVCSLLALRLTERGPVNAPAAERRMG